MPEQELKPRGTVDPTKKPTWLKEVKLDAARNTVEHLRRQKESQEFERAKARGLTVEEVVSKGREDLDLQPTYDFEEDQQDAQLQSDNSEEVADLKKELQKERAARTRAENKLKAQEESQESEKGSEDSAPAEKEAK